jgi:5-hydroxyisourate hydrolase
MARLSTHVLDTSRGMPAAGIELELHFRGDRAWGLVTTAVTNADGRTDAPLLSGARIDPGTYELRFSAAAYFKGVGVPLTDPPFLEVIVIRFGIADPEGDYHVPLLLSPYGYSTYRGS